MSASVVRKKIIIKPSYNYEFLKNTIEKRLNKLYPSSDLEKKILDYDLDIEEEFLKQIDKKDTSVNYDLISRLPKIKSTINIPINMENDLDEEPETVEQSVDMQDNLEIDTSCLEKELVGDKWYFFDHTKGIIYDTKYNAIGNIDDHGEIIIES